MPIRVRMASMSFRSDVCGIDVTRIVNEPASILPIHISFPGIDDDIMSDALSRLEKEGGLGGRGGIQDL